MLNIGNFQFRLCANLLRMHACSGNMSNEQGRSSIAALCSREY